MRITVPLDQKGSGAVDPELYKSRTPGIAWDSPIVPPIVLRTDPVFLDAQELEAPGGSGFLAFVDPIVRRQKMLEEQQQSRPAQRPAKERERKGGKQTKIAAAIAREVARWTEWAMSSTRSTRSAAGGWHGKARRCTVAGLRGSPSRALGDRRRQDSN